MHENDEAPSESSEGASLHLEALTSKP